MSDQLSTDTRTMHARLLTLIQQNAQPAEIDSAVLVGSTARGYALDSSDIDVMVFYGPKTSPQSTAEHFEWEGRRTTVEHHDADVFYSEALAFRQSIGALRQLLKIRDGVVLRSSSFLGHLQHLAARASLDQVVLLDALQMLAARWDQLIGKRGPAQRYRLLRWTEVLATLWLLAQPGAPAYSKPKWLYLSLDEASDSQFVEVLRYLDQKLYPDPTRILGAIDEICVRLPCFDDGDLLGRFAKTCANDARALLEHRPDEAGPTLRLFGTIFHRVLYGSDPLDVIDRGQEFELRAMELLFPRVFVSDYHEEESLREFRTLTLSLASRVVRQLRQEWATEIGSRRLMPILLSGYDVPDLLQLAHCMRASVPGAGADRLEEWAGLVDAWHIETNRIHSAEPR